MATNSSVPTPSIHQQKWLAGSSLQIVSTTLLTIILLAFAVVVAAASGVEEVRMEDRCDAATFPAEAGCIGHGGVTFAEFSAELNPHDGGHDAWKFNPHNTHIDAGETLRAVNIGGEPHSFTEVFNFGAGLVPPLNGALLPGTAPAVPVNPAGVAATFAGPGQSFEISGLSVGVHKFQCLIHPWMRTTVEVRTK